MATPFYDRLVDKADVTGHRVELSVKNNVFDELRVVTPTGDVLGSIRVDSSLEGAAARLTRKLKWS